MIFISSMAIGATSNIKTSPNTDIKTEFYESGNVKYKSVKTYSCYLVTKYYESGTVEEVGYYSFSGEKIGNWERYSQDGKLISTQQLNFEVKRVGFLTTTFC